MLFGFVIGWYAGVLWAAYLASLYKPELPEIRQRGATESNRLAVPTRWKPGMPHTPVYDGRRTLPHWKRDGGP